MSFLKDVLLTRTILSAVIALIITLSKPVADYFGMDILWYVVTLVIWGFTILSFILDLLNKNKNLTLKDERIKEIKANTKKIIVETESSKKANELYELQIEDLKRRLEKTKSKEERDVEIEKQHRDLANDMVKISEKIFPQSGLEKEKNIGHFLVRQKTMEKDIEKANLLVREGKDMVIAQKTLAIGTIESRYYYAKFMLSDQKCWNTLDHFLSISILQRAGLTQSVKKMKEEVEYKPEQFDKNFMEILTLLYSNNRFVHYLVPELEFFIRKYNYSTFIPEKTKKEFYNFLEKLSENILVPEIQKIETEDIVESTQFGSIFVGLSYKEVKDYIKAILKLRKQGVKRMFIEARRDDKIKLAKEVIKKLNELIKLDDYREKEEETTYKGKINVKSFWANFSI